MIIPELLNELREVFDVLDTSCQIALRQPLPNKQLILITELSFQSKGCAVLTINDPLQKFTSTRNLFASVAYGSKAFRP